MVKIETKKRYNLKIAIIKMKRKEKYESPFMERTLVVLEDGFCAASVAEHTKPKGIKTIGHELNEIDVTGESWNVLVNEGSGAGSNGWE